MLSELETSGLAGNTLVWFTSDHGPATLSKNRAERRNFGRSTPYRGHKYGLWEGSLRVPGIVRWPGVVRAGSRNATPCGSIDWFATFTEIATGSGPETSDGASLLGLLKSKTPPTRSVQLQWHHYNATLKHRPNPNVVLLEDDWLICGFYEDRPKGTGRWVIAHMPFIKTAPLKRWALYHLPNDPKQETDLSALEPERFLRMKKRLIESHKLQQDAAFARA